MFQYIVLKFCDILGVTHVIRPYNPDNDKYRRIGEVYDILVICNSSWLPATDCLFHAHAHKSFLVGFLFEDFSTTVVKRTGFWVSRFMGIDGILLTCDLIYIIISIHILICIYRAYICQSFVGAFLSKK